MMARYIERGETLLIPFHNGKSLTDSQLRPRIYKTMQMLENSLHFKEGYEVAEYVEQKHGRWEEAHEIKSFKHTNIPVVQCSKCECYFCDIINNHHYMYHYCPNCGAKMDGETQSPPGSSSNSSSPDM